MSHHHHQHPHPKPTVGRIVFYREADHEGHAPDAAGGPTDPDHPGSNGTREHPAIITRVWSDTCVNLHVFTDAHATRIRTSVSLLPELPEGTSGAAGWRWPVRD